MMRKVTLIVTAMAAMLVGLALPASAHSALQSSNPADGAVLDAAPETIALTFNQPVEVRIDDTILTAADGNVIPFATSEVDGAVVTLVLGGDLPAGTHALQWSVASADGHPINGVIRFTTLAGVATTVTPTTEPPSTSGVASSIPAAIDPEGPDADDPHDSATSEPAVDDDSGESSSTPFIVIGALVAIAVVGAVVVIARGSKNKAQD